MLFRRSKVLLWRKFASVQKPNNTYRTLKTRAAVVTPKRWPSLFQFRQDKSQAHYLYHHSPVMMMARLASTNIAAKPEPRSVFITTAPTPNPESMKYYPGQQIMGDKGTMDFPNYAAASNSLLAKELFKLESVQRVFFGPNFVTITKKEGYTWEYVNSFVYSALMDFFATDKPIFQDKDTRSDTTVTEEDSEVVAMIKELIETRIRPSVQDDGGDITFLAYHEQVVFLLMQGSCSGCPSSAVTLKSGVERMLQHWISEVQGVVAVDSVEEFEKLVKSPEDRKDKIAMQQVGDKQFETTESKLRKQMGITEADDRPGLHLHGGRSEL